MTFLYIFAKAIVQQNYKKRLIQSRLIDVLTDAECTLCLVH